MRSESVIIDVELNRRWRPALMAFFLRRVRDPAEAEDLTQEVFIRMLATADPAVHPDAFVFQIARNLIIDRARKLKIRANYRDAIAQDKLRHVDPLDPHQVASGKEHMATFVAAITELPERTRAMFILYRFENMSQDVIGASYGISASAVKQHIAKAMAVLNRKMRDVR